MKTTLEFRATDYSPQALQLIMAKAEEWQVPPGQALERLLNELAEQDLSHPKAA